VVIHKYAAKNDRLIAKVIMIATHMHFP